MSQEEPNYAALLSEKLKSIHSELLAAAAEQQGTLTPRTEEVESLIAILGDGAAKLRDDKYSDELAQAMDDAVEALSELSRSREDCERLREALKQAHDAMEAFTDPEGNMPERTGEFNDLKKALHATSAALAATRKDSSNG